MGILTLFMTDGEVAIGVIARGSISPMDSRPFLAKREPSWFGNVAFTQMDPLIRHLLRILDFSSTTGCSAPQVPIQLIIDSQMIKILF